MEQNVVLKWASEAFFNFFNIHPIKKTETGNSIPDTHFDKLIFWLGQPTLCVEIYSKHSLR